VAHTSAPKVPTKSAKEKLIFHVLAKYPAGIIATSLGNGIKLDSNTIIIKIPTYQNCSAISTI